MTVSFLLHRLTLCALALAWPLASAADTSIPPDNARLRDTRWVLQTLDGSPVALPEAATKPVHLVLQAKSQHLVGFAGCNSIRGRYTQRGTQLAVKAISSTRMACPQMEQEQRFIDALTAADGYRIEGQTLSLLQGDAVRATFLKGGSAK